MNRKARSPMMVYGGYRSDGGAVAVRRVVCLCVLVSVCATPAGAENPAQVRPAELARLTPASFTDDELSLPYYLAHFHRIANSVVMTGEDRGFIDIAVWRNEQDNRPHNARIMENILSLAFFYVTDRAWNPYRGDAALRARLEAAVAFWIRSQSEDGRFSEYAPERWGLAPTAFGTKFMGETLRLLKEGPPIDAELHRRLVAADRKAILAVLTNPELYEHGRRFSNQYSNVWAGALAYLALYPDAEVEQKLRARVERARADHQSPAGYFYEHDGADWSYNLGTHHSNLHMAWHYARGSELGERFAEETKRWYEWLSYNAVPEPDGSGFTLNRGIETRTLRPFVTDAGQVVSEIGNLMAEQVELARILGPTQDEVAARRARQRAELERRWPSVDSLVLGSFSSFSPYAFLHRDHHRWYPTREQKLAALARLPYVARDRFTHQRADTRRAVVFTYIRRPAYYAAFNAGELWREQQRYGLGLLWTPEAGAVLQSQTASRAAAWGTRAAADTLVYEATSFTPEFRVNGEAVAVAATNRDLPPGDVVVGYALSSRGHKTVTFADRGIRVEVEHPGAFVEQIPLLVLSPAEVKRSAAGIELRRGGTVLTVRVQAPATVAVDETELSVGDKRVLAVSIRSSDRLSYSLDIGKHALQN